MTETRRISDPEALKGLTQPLRRKLYRLLVQLGPATVGALAKKVDGDPGQVSYHLRELAKHGFIQEAPELARDKRERWWQAIPGGTSWSSTEFDASPEARAIADTLKRQMITDEFERAVQWEKDRETWAEAWQHSVMSNESNLFLTAEELKQMNAELLELLAAWGARGRQARDEGRTEGREAVFMFMHDFPERP